MLSINRLNNTYRHLSPLKNAIALSTPIKLTGDALKLLWGASPQRNTRLLPIRDRCRHEDSSVPTLCKADLQRSCSRMVNAIAALNLKEINAIALYDARALEAIAFSIIKAVKAIAP